MSTLWTPGAEEPQGGGEVESLIELHDSELIAAMNVVERLNRKQKTMQNLEGFRKEIIERFALEANLKVDVAVYETNEAGTAWFQVTILSRIEGQFDPDRQVHEVTHDILEMGDGGVIKTGLTPDDV